MDYEKCGTATEAPSIVVKENRSRFEVENPNRYVCHKIKVDGCLITDEYEKCDWIISTNDPVKRAFFVELKGCNVDKAISQLKSTLDYTSDKYKGYKKECFAVTTRIPKHGPSIRKKCLEFHKSTKATLIIKNLKGSIALNS